MSSRALRKLQGTENLVVDVEDDLNEHDELDTQEKAFNPFDLLNEEEVDDAVNNIQSEEEGEIRQHKHEESNKNKKKKKKKKKAGKEKGNILGATKDDEVDIEASVREVNSILGEATPFQFSTGQDQIQPVTAIMKSLLNVEHKHLNPDNELKRIFGSRVVQAEQSRRKDRNRQQKHYKATWLTQPKDSWPAVGKFGISMKKDNGGTFLFEHSKDYQKIQYMFLDAVESFNPENLMSLLHLHPYHIDCLLQLSEVCRMSDDLQMASELIERSLYCFECNFHPLFSLTSGNCRLDYKRPENRAFYLSIFRRLLFVGQKGCYRTALELCKLLLSLDTDEDPLAVILMIDFYSLKSEQYSFLVRMFDEWEAHRNLSQLPNFAFSVPLALYHEAMEGKSSLGRADSMLQNSLLMFPGLLLPLLDQCSISPDNTVSSHQFFGTATQLQQPDALKQLVALYVGRCFHCWKAQNVVEWLERNVQEVIHRVDIGEPLADEYMKKTRSRYKGTPRNIYRHIILSEVKDATTALPPEMANTPMMSYDPLPPVDSISSYTRPERPTRAQQGHGMFSSFLQSMLPNYNPQEIVEVQGAEGGEGIRAGVGALMDAMRELLNNIRPVEPPREDNVDPDNVVEEQEWD